MVIPENMRQFEHERALIITSGSERAKLYYAYNGTLEEHENFHFPNPEHFIDKNFFEPMPNSTQEFFNAVASFDPDREHTMPGFIKFLHLRVEEISKALKIDSIYLFAPSYLVNQFKKRFDLGTQKLSFVSSGNYTKVHPLDFLGKIPREGRWERII